MIGVVGLDLSLTSTGIAVGEETHIISSKYQGPWRLSDIAHQILQYMPERESPGGYCVVLEGYSFAQKASQAHSIGELGGVVKVALVDWLTPYIEVPPSNRAKFATGRGNASKGEVISAISSRTGQVFTGAGADDLCDAWVLQEMGLAALGRARYNWPELNMTALDKVDWTRLREVDNATKSD